MGQLREGVAATYRRALLLIGGFAVVSIVLALVLGFVISWSFILPVRGADDFLGQVAAGDFGGTHRGAEPRRVRRAGRPA